MTHKITDYKLRREKHFINKKRQPSVGETNVILIIDTYLALTTIKCTEMLHFPYLAVGSFLSW